jgi:hypothetical protein
MNTFNEDQRAFIEAVADYITSDLALKSMSLQAGKPDAQKWAKAYQAAKCHGYATKAEAVAAISKLMQPPKFTPSKN